MINLGIVGTGWISDSFAEGCIRTGQYQIKAVCSREIERAEEFGKRYGASLFFTDVRDLAASSEVDAVYIASPNSLHYEQCMTVLRAGKHAIVEKPLCSNISQVASAFAVAQEQGVLLLEAIRNIHEENHRIVKEQIGGIGPMCGAYLSYLQKSSKYDRLLAGEAPNVFSLRYSGGVLMDLGIYLIYDAVDWFGVPLDARYDCRKLATGADGSGIVLLNYPDFDAVLNVSKVSNSWLQNELRGSEKTIILDTAQYIGSVLIMDDNSESVELAAPRKPHLLEDEARCFADIITETASPGHYETLRNLALNVHTLLTKLRLQAGIVFSADES